jgi:hypothetical protein
MTRLLQCGSSLFLALLLLCPPGKAAAGEDIGVSVIKDLFAQLWDYQSGKTEGRKHVDFDIPETLVNQYIAYLINSQTRLGVQQATIKIIAKNKVDIACSLDLKQIKAWDPKVIGPGSSLDGKDNLQVHATASVDITDGLARVAILSASGAPANSSKIQDLFRVVASNQPEHFDLNKPIKLPFALSVAMVDGVFYGKTPRRAPH